MSTMKWLWNEWVGDILIKLNRKLNVMNESKTVPGFAHSGVKDRGFVTRIGSNEKNPISLFNSCDGRIQQVVGAEVGSRGFVHRESLFGTQRFAAQTVEQVFQGNQSLRTKFYKNCDVRKTTNIQFVFLSLVR